MSFAADENSGPKLLDSDDVTVAGRPTAATASYQRLDPD
jgi:hypothetical protein